MARHQCRGYSSGLERNADEFTRDVLIALLSFPANCYIGDYSFFPPRNHPQFVTCWRISISELFSLELSTANISSSSASDNGLLTLETSCRKYSSMKGKYPDNSTAIRLHDIDTAASKYQAQGLLTVIDRNSD